MHHLYSCGNWALGYFWLWKTTVEPPQRWQWLHLIFSALTQESTSMAQPLQLLKLNFNRFLVPKHDCTTSNGPPQQWKRLYLILPALKQQSTSITQPLHLRKSGFRTFLVQNAAFTTSTTMWMTLSDLPNADTGVHKHHTTSTVVEIGL